jgi:hypothetical protein
MNDATTETGPVEAGRLSGLNGFLVIGRCGCDDIPLAMVESRQAAKQLAANLTKDDVKNAAYDVFSLDVRQVIGTSIVPIRNGLPLAADCTREFGEES